MEHLKRNWAKDEEAGSRWSSRVTGGNRSCMDHVLYAPNEADLLAIELYNWYLVVLLPASLVQGRENQLIIIPTSNYDLMKRQQRRVDIDREEVNDIYVTDTLLSTDCNRSCLRIEAQQGITMMSSRNIDLSHLY